MGAKGKFPFGIIYVQDPQHWAYTYLAKAQNESVLEEPITSWPGIHGVIIDSRKFLYYAENGKKVEQVMHILRGGSEWHEDN